MNAEIIEAIINIIIMKSLNCFINLINIFLKGYYDCHVLNDLVLVYKIEKEKLVLLLFDIETHSNLFTLL